MGTKAVQMDKATTMMRDVVKYAREVARDERLRTDIRAALDHGFKASDLAAALAFPRVRPWLEARAAGMFGSGSAEPDLS